MTWRRCADLPVATSAPQVVRIGDIIYVGGGYREPGASKAVFQYSVHMDAWTPLPPCPTHQHGLTSLRGRLVAIGGILRESSGKVTNVVLTFGDGHKWKEELPPMPTSRSLLSTTSHDDQLVVAAGGVTGTECNGTCVRTDVVEILAEGSWYKTPSLPFPTYTLSMCSLGNRIYALGGVGSPHQSRTTLYVHLSSLLGDAEIIESDYVTLHQSLKTWQRLRGRHPLPSSSLLELDGKLMAFGGEAWHKRNIRGTPVVTMYNFDTDTWVECKGASLPVPVYRPGVVRLGSDEVMVVGGENTMQRLTSQVNITEPVGMLEVYNRWREPPYSKIT